MDRCPHMQRRRPTVGIGDVRGAVERGEQRALALDGGTVKLRIKPGSQSGSRHRVKEKGVTRTTAKGPVTGSLIVTVDVVVPTELNDAQRTAVEAFAAASTVSGGQE